MQSSFGSLEHVDILLYLFVLYIVVSFKYKLFDKSATLWIIN